MSSDATATPQSEQVLPLALAVLKEDRAFRRVGVDGDLKSLSELTPESWDYSSPTLFREEPDSEAYAELKLCSEKGFSKRFYETYPMLKGVPLDGMLVAGGSVGQFIRLKKGKSIWHAEDVDVFLYGHKTVDDSTARLNRFISDLDKASHFQGKEEVGLAIAAQLKLASERCVLLMQQAGQRTVGYSHADPRAGHAGHADPRAGHVDTYSGGGIRIARKGLNDISTASLATVNAWIAVLTRVQSHLGDSSKFVRVTLDSTRAYVDRQEDDDDDDSEHDQRFDAIDHAVKYRMVQPHDVSSSDWALVALLCEYQVPCVSVIRTAGCITIDCRGRGRGAQDAHANIKIQVIFRHYATISEILHGFDIGSSAIGFDGEHVWLTGLGAFSYAYGVNIVDPSRRSPTYESRMYKYWLRGFRIVMPHLSTMLLGSKPELKYGLSTIADLPFMPFSYSGISGGRICLQNFVRQFEFRSDYGPEGELDDEIDNEGDFRIAFMNLRRLIAERTDFMYAAHKHGIDGARDVLTRAPHLTVEMIQKLYDRFRLAVWNGRNLNLHVLRHYVPCADIVKIVSAPNSAAMNSLIDEAFTKQRADATRLWKKNIRDADHSRIPWIVDNPGKQGLLSGSRQPIETTLLEWYGPACFEPTPK